jgi:hypothetical protein
LVKKTAPTFATTVKWGQGCFVDGTMPKIYIHVEDDHVQFGFYQGSSLTDANNVLSGNGKYVRHIKVRTVKDIDVNVFGAFIAQITA